MVKNKNLWFYKFNQFETYPLSILRIIHIFILRIIVWIGPDIFNSFSWLFTSAKINERDRLRVKEQRILSRADWKSYFLVSFFSIIFTESELESSVDDFNTLRFFLVAVAGSVLKRFSESDEWQLSFFFLRERKRSKVRNTVQIASSSIYSQATYFKSAASLLRIRAAIFSSSLESEYKSFALSKPSLRHDARFFFSFCKKNYS